MSKLTTDIFVFVLLYLTSSEPIYILLFSESSVSQSPRCTLCLCERETAPGRHEFGRRAAAVLCFCSPTGLLGDAKCTMQTNSRIRKLPCVRNWRLLVPTESTQPTATGAVPAYSTAQAGERDTEQKLRLLAMSCSCCHACQPAWHYLLCWITSALPEHLRFWTVFAVPESGPLLGILDPMKEYWLKNIVYC